MRPPGRAGFLRAARLAGAAVLTGLAILSGAAVPAAASCVPPPALEEAVRTAEVVFVGTVMEAANRGRTATVRVEEVWRGPDLGATVVVDGLGSPIGSPDADGVRERRGKPASTRRTASKGISPQGV